MLIAKIAAQFALDAGIIELLANVPEQLPDHPENVEPKSGAAVSVTDELRAKLAAHAAPQFIPAGIDVTLPVPVPGLATESETSFTETNGSPNRDFAALGYNEASLSALEAKMGTAEMLKIVDWPKQPSDQFFLFTGSPDQRFRLDRGTDLKTWESGDAREITDPVGWFESSMWGSRLITSSDEAMTTGSCASAIGLARGDRARAAARPMRRSHGTVRGESL